MYGIIFNMMKLSVYAGIGRLQTQDIISGCHGFPFHKIWKILLVELNGQTDVQLMVGYQYHSVQLVVGLHIMDEHVLALIVNGRLQLVPSFYVLLRKFFSSDHLFGRYTIAFKDMALSILPYLMTTAARKNNVKNEIVILTATSGDTGKAALAGFADVPGTRIIVFYPKHGVSPIQEKQIVAQKGANTYVVGITGNFDDAQTAVKKMFNDKELAAELSQAGFQFSSANSINIGRLVPQIVYYVYAYAALVRQNKIEAGQEINIVVPTGNFGNILAAFYAKQMGLPVNKLICASNENKVLFDFFSTGTYNRKRDFILTSSPSMDILISSNLERLIYRITGGNPEECAKLMENLSKGGEYTITPEMKAQLKDFYGNYCSEEETKEAIREVYKTSDYVIDTHTAVAADVYKKYVKDTGDKIPAVIASTASPYKFTRSVMDAISEGHENLDDFGLVDALEKLSGVAVPKAVNDIRTAPVLHDRVVDAEDMPATVKEILKIS